MPTLPKTHSQRQQRQRDRQRGSAAARGYGHAWRKLRTYVLRHEPMCRACKVQPATDVDHVVSRRKGGTDELENLQPLCGACHKAKSVREDGALG